MNEVGRRVAFELTLLVQFVATGSEFNADEGRSATQPDVLIVPAS